MNRKQRRAGSKQASAGGTPGQSAAQLFADAMRAHQQNRTDEAVRAYKRLLLLMPDHAEASNNLACMLLAQGKLAEASPRFARALELRPQLFEQFGAIRPTLMAVLPPLGQAMQRVHQAWPQRLPLDRLLDDAGLATIAGDPLLRAILEGAPVRDVAFERLLTTLRAALLAQAAASAVHNDSVLACSCTVAQQCFINEYVFATTPAEDEQVDQLKTNLRDISPMRLAALAMYLPLHALPDAQALLARTWPDDVNAVVTQQLREPMQERALRDSIPQLTAIEDATSQRVRQMYEENPYPRWVHGPVDPTSTFDHYLRAMFPTAAFISLGKTGAFDMLVAGCGTGQHPITVAEKFPSAHVLAIDLSLASLAYAKRKTPPALAGRIEYAQADILKLGTLDRCFDVIDASGVLHHMADPLTGWRTLLALLRPNGFMHLGFYSELGRRDVVAARAFIAERGYSTTPSEIRRARQDLLATPLACVTRFNDFFATSECRDLLFHVQESRTSIPAIKTFLAERNLKFIGFEFTEPVLRRYRALFAEQRWLLTDLNHWHNFETKYPDTFSGMYQFWVQKAA